MWACYALVQNFGWAIIIFTFIVKAAMFPLNLKQQKNMAVSQLFMPRVKEIQTKYKNNQAKQQEELTKLQKEGYNPTGGCGTMLLTFIILFGVIDVVYKPMTHMEHFSKEQINSIVETAEELDFTRLMLACPDDAELIIEYSNEEFLKDKKFEAYSIFLNKEKNDQQVVLPDDFNLDETEKTLVINQQNVDDYGALFRKLSAEEFKKTSRMSELLKNINKTKLSNTFRTSLNKLSVNYSRSNLYYELRALKSYGDENVRQFFARKELVTEDISNRLDKLLSERMYFGPLNLIDQPTWEWPLVIIPIIAFLFSFAQMLISQWLTNKQNPEMANQSGSMKIMLLIMPFISLGISFSVPAGVGFYWAVSYLFGILQSIITFKFWPSDKIRAEAQAKMEEKAKLTEQKATVIEVDAEGNTKEKTARLSELSQKELKELNRKKIEAARKADAEKYGEVYVESPDDEDF